VKKTELMFIISVGGNSERRQVYFVYPLIEESETLDYKNLMEDWKMSWIIFQSIM
jgi:RecG-like helicase